MKLLHASGAIASLLIGPANTAICGDLAVNQDGDMIIKGLNLNHYNQIVEDVRANPAHGRVEFRATGESACSGGINK